MIGERKIYSKIVLKKGDLSLSSKRIQFESLDTIIFQTIWIYILFKYQRFHPFHLVKSRIFLFLVAFYHKKRYKYLLIFRRNHISSPFRLLPVLFKIKEENQQNQRNLEKEL